MTKALPCLPDEIRRIGIAECDDEAVLVAVVVLVDTLEMGDTGFVEWAVREGAERFGVDDCIRLGWRDFGRGCFRG